MDNEPKDVNGITFSDVCGWQLLTSPKGEIFRLNSVCNQRKESDYSKITEEICST